MASGTDNFPSRSNWANFKAGKFLKSEVLAPLWYVRTAFRFCVWCWWKSTSFFFRHGSIIITPSGSQVKSSSPLLYYPSHSSVVVQGTNGQTALFCSYWPKPIMVRFEESLLHTAQLKLYGFPKNSLRLVQPFFRHFEKKTQGPKTSKLKKKPLNNSRKKLKVWASFKEIVLI